MTKIKDILDPKKLVDMQKEKRIGKQVHPTLPLCVYNYTNLAQFTNLWTHEERVCRGLIVDFEGNVIARGPSKFFNYGQPGAPEVAMDDWVRITRKEDGSLGIGWEFEGNYGVATRGSFMSDQAVHATKLLSTDDKANIDWAKKKDLSRIWEIVYPENRIVLSYGGRDELIPLGTVGNISGLIQYRPKRIVQAFDNKLELTFAEAIALPIPDNEEGYVLDIISGSSESIGHIKLKGDRYKELHGAIFGLSERKIWEAMGREDDMDEFIASLPDELIPWAQGVVNRIGNEWDELYQSVVTAVASTLTHFESADGVIPRRDLAQYIMANHKDISGPVFSMFDGKYNSVVEWSHKQIRPEHKLFRVEDNSAN